MIVLTDGLWRAMPTGSEVEDLIIKFDKMLKEIRETELLTRPVSIEFVSFGSDADAIYRLRHLDNDLKFDEGIE